MNTNEIFERFNNSEMLTKKDALTLLNIPNHSAEFYELIGLADHYTREKFQGKGYVFGQVGINASKCSVDCNFCALATSHFRFDQEIEKDLEAIKAEVLAFVKEGAQEVFLMTTADYSTETFINYGSEIRKILPEGMKLVANIGDFNLETARKLKEAGFTGCYHICRLGEGKDTKAKPEIRIKTLEAIKEAGLELYYCVEPIGPEHTYEEIVEEMFRPGDYPVEVMAAMRRIPVPGTPLFDKGQISAVELAKIIATIVLCMRPIRAMGVHEPTSNCLIAGANQIYAEVGINPRDCAVETKGNRGFSVADAKEMLRDASWEIKHTF